MFPERKERRSSKDNWLKQEKPIEHQRELGWTVPLLAPLRRFFLPIHKYWLVTRGDAVCFRSKPR